MGNRLANPVPQYLNASGEILSGGQIFFYNALKLGEASRVVPLGATYPLISFILAVFLLGEKFTLAKLGGIILVLSGIFLLK